MGALNVCSDNNHLINWHRLTWGSLQTVTAYFN